MPLNVFAPERVSVPEPDFVRPPVPVTVPENVRSAEPLAVRVPAPIEIVPEPWIDPILVDWDDVRFTSNVAPDDTVIGELADRLPAGLFERRSVPSVTSVAPV